MLTYWREGIDSYDSEKWMPLTQESLAESGKTLGTGALLCPRAAVPNIFGTRGQFCGRQFFHRLGGGGKIEGRRRRGRQRMRRLDGITESEWTPGVGDGQGGLACCSPWGHKESHTTERLNWAELGGGGERVPGASGTLRLLWLCFSYHFTSSPSGHQALDPKGKPHPRALFFLKKEFVCLFF